MANITLRVNGKTHTVDVEPATPLLYVLRNDLGLQGPRFGCGLGQCGACTVLIKGEAVRSCVQAGVGRAGRRDHDARRARPERQAASGAAGVDRRAGAAVRLLPERPDPHRQGAARQEPESDRRARSARAMQGALCRCMTYYRVQAAIKRAAKAMAARTADQPGRRGGAHDALAETSSRRSGMLVVGFSARRRAVGHARWPGAAGQAPGPYPDPDFRQLDSWIVIREDNTATFYVGKTDLGQGTGTAFRQIMADELDIAYDKTSVRDGQHRRHRRSGRVGRIRRAADRRLADAPRRRRSAPRAARHGRDAAWACRSTALVVSEGVVSVAADPSQKVTYGELIGGRRSTSR